MDLSALRIKSTWALKTNLCKVPTILKTHTLTVVLGKNNNILNEISKKWNEKADLDLAPFLLSKSLRFISRIENLYLRYIQYRTLHRRFYTNNMYSVKLV